MRVAEFFRDFDKLRSFSIPRRDFIRGIDRLGVPLSDDEYDVLAAYYADQTKQGCCKWKSFEEDVERGKEFLRGIDAFYPRLFTGHALVVLPVFGETHLESRPSIPPEPLPIHPDPFLTSSALTYDEESLLQNTLQLLRDFLRVRQTSIKPFFKDFDKVH